MNTTLTISLLVAIAVHLTQADPVSITLHDFTDLFFNINFSGTLIRAFTSNQPRQRTSQSITLTSGMKSWFNPDPALVNLVFGYQQEIMKIMRLVAQRRGKPVYLLDSMNRPTFKRNQGEDAVRLYRKRSSPSFNLHGHMKQQRPQVFLQQQYLDDQPQPYDLDDDLTEAMYHNEPALNKRWPENEGLGSDEIRLYRKRQEGSIRLYKKDGIRLY